MHVPVPDHPEEAQCIPELATADPERLAAVVSTVDGQVSGAVAQRPLRSSVHVDSSRARAEVLAGQLVGGSGRCRRSRTRVRSRARRRTR